MAEQPRPIGFWLRLVDRLLEERFAEVLEEHGVTRRQWQLLSVLAGGEASVEQLDAAVAPFRSEGDEDSAVEHLTELIESGWVAATAVGYELTPRGLLAFEKLSEVVSELRGSVGAGVSGDEYAQTLEILERMARNLGWQEEAQAQDEAGDEAQAQDEA
ncbi:MarR family winged helix-turn-helix transcriptional regulator [Diaminobutyricimonas sp. LJ205]|uniref:MarR family winged helix-turn-helix transcriptional regulator n=1 Tax=Diaminobutyricimonas sp. LJ205 TaxID=2683590 RepID=UPI0012F4A48E|nr:MarR family transcriptional regulator [Diaminobutyricimonas sp. LJ205]